MQGDEVADLGKVLDEVFGGGVVDGDVEVVRQRDDRADPPLIPCFAAEG